MQPGDVDGDIDNCSNVYFILNMMKTMKKNNDPSVNKGKTIEKMLVKQDLAYAMWYINTGLFITDGVKIIYNYTCI